MAKNARKGILLVAPGGNGLIRNGQVGAIEAIKAAVEGRARAEVGEK